MPEFLEGPSLSFDKKPTEKDVDILNLELNKLDYKTNDLELKKSLLQNVHVVHLETSIDNLTGYCKGKSFVQIRCPDKEKSKQIIDQLTEKGVDCKVVNKENWQ